MNEGTYITEDELFKKALAILTENLGVMETSRFLSLSKQKRIESVKRHRTWQAKLNNDEFFKEIFK